ncbi:MAG: aminotransferase [Bacteroidota bacterium]|nr:aminotransferase [Bacteroidota bacterium]
MNPAATETAAMDMASVLHPFTPLRKHVEQGPFVIDRAEGVWLYDEAGRRYLDGIAGLWCASLGYSEPRLAEAARRQFERLPFMHMFVSFSHSPGAELAGRLLDIAPVTMSKVFFANSGSEAVDSAIKMVWYYNNAVGRPAKKKIIARRDAYHGSLIGSGSVTGLPKNHQLFDLPIANILHTGKPHHFRFGHPGESEEEFGRRRADELEAQILSEGPDTVAAFIAEPIMGVGGVIVPPAGYFDAVQEVLERHDVLMIADEVICGLGRTGNMWGSQTCAIRPDMLVSAKALSASYLPISAVMVNERVHRGLMQGSDEVGVFAQGMTYSGHPVSAAVALECLNIYEDRDIVAHVRAVGEKLQEGLSQRYGDHPLVGEVRGRGLMAGVELVADRDSSTPTPADINAGAVCQQHAKAHGLILRNMGNNLGFSPPLIITDEEIEFLLDTFGVALDETYREIATA